MKRCNLVYNHPVYQECIKRINEKEKDRKFCLHNLAHSLDTARIGYIMIIENNLDIDKELFYAAALLHDAGRYTGKPHNESGADIAELIMPDCGFTTEEIETVCSAILGHRTKTDESDFSSVLYAADKKSRVCFACEAATECYWKKEKRNNIIEL